VYLKLEILRKGNTVLMHCSLFIATSALNSIILVWKRLVFEFLLDICEIFFFMFNARSSIKFCHPSICASAANVVYKGVAYLEPNLLPRIFIYSGTFLIINVLVVFTINALIQICFSIVFVSMRLFVSFLVRAYFTIDHWTLSRHVNTQRTELNHHNYYHYDHYY
jgi:hypothetical protein